MIVNAVRTSDSRPTCQTTSDFVGAFTPGNDSFTLTASGHERSMDWQTRHLLRDRSRLSHHPHPLATGHGHRRSR